MRSFFWLQIKVDNGINVNLFVSSWNVTATWKDSLIDMKDMHTCWYDLWDSLFVIQCSAGRRRLCSKLCKTELTEGLWTSWRTKRWDWNRRNKTTITHRTVSLNVTVTKTRKRAKFSINIVNSTHTAACCYCYLYGIPARFTHILQMKKVYASFVVPLLQFTRKAPC